MASIRKKEGSKFWYAAFTLPNGRRVQHSTKQTDRKRAQRIADQWDEAFRARVAVKQSQRVISKIHQELTGAVIPNRTTQEYFTNWLASKKPETKPATHVFYKGVVDSFLRFLDGRATADLIEVSKDDVLAFRESMAGVVSTKTINHRVKGLRMVFGQAKKDGLIPDNPAEAVRTLSGGNSVRRRAFTIAELKAILEHCDEEWKSLVYFGLYTGQRLGDLAALTWQNIDLPTKEIQLVTKKTGRSQVIPIAPSLLQLLRSTAAPTDPRAPLHPRAFAEVIRRGRAATLSQSFYGIMTKAGIVEARTHAKRKTSGPRQFSEISFHSLRHTATSLMKQAGVGAAVVQDLIGHDSEAISRHYTHIADASKREALRKLPSLG